MLGSLYVKHVKIGPMVRKKEKKYMPANILVKAASKDPGFKIIKVAEIIL